MDAAAAQQPEQQHWQQPQAAPDAVIQHQSDDGTGIVIVESASSARKYQSAVTLNNIGFVAIERDLRLALECFTAALECIMRGAAEFEVVSSATNTPIHPIPPAAQGQQEPAVPHNALDLLPGNSDGAPGMMLNYPQDFLPEARALVEAAPAFRQNAFARPMVLTPGGNAINGTHPRDLQQQPELNFAVTSALIMFNVAVVCHRSGQQELGTDDVFSQHNLFVAEVFYSRVVDALLSLGVSLKQSSGHPAVDVLVMAVHNNLAQITHLQSSFDASIVHLRDLITFAQSVNPEAHPYDVATTSALRWHVAAFLGNVCSLQPPELAPAA